MGTLRHLASALDPTLMMQAAGLEPDPWQTELLRSDDKRMLVLCCRQSGKSTVAAVMALHTALYTPNSLTLLLSPSERQSAELFRKVITAYRAARSPVPTQTQTTLRLELANGSRVIALPAGEETIRGYSGVNLLIIDEAARVPDELYYSIRPMLAVSGGRLAALSTPWGRKGWFYHEWAHSEYWKKIKITARECPRLTEEILEQERESLGEWWFRQEYLCEFVEAGGEGFIYADWLEAAAKLEIDQQRVWQAEPIDLGLDVARSAKGDKTVFVTVKGGVVLDIESSRQDLMATCGKAVRLIDACGARSIRIDDTGVGGGVTDRLVEVSNARNASHQLRNCEIIPIAFGERPSNEERFVNIRAEMWWNVGEKLRTGQLQIPRHPELWEQLMAPEMSQDSSGRLRLESKDSMKRRGIASPDVADALALACYPDEWFVRSRILYAF